MKKILLIFLFLFLTFYDAYSYAHMIQNEISDKVIRLHVVADSDDSKAQELKLKVRDSILNFMKDKNYKDYATAYSSISNSLKELEKIAEDTLVENNCFNNVTVELDEFAFPQKSYDTLSFPSGIYTALRVQIGSGNGQNWWCVMYPTLCFSETTCSDSVAKLNLEESLSQESFSIISQKCEFKFKIVDFFNSFKF